MSMTIQIDLWCDRCSSWDTVTSLSKGTISILKARVIMKKRGWSTSKQYGRKIDLCKKCSSHP